jgi:hypothetical protein
MAQAEQKNKKVRDRVSVGDSGILQTGGAEGSYLKEQWNTKTPLEQNKTSDPKQHRG